MSGPALDPRLHAFRPDLADHRLKGRVEAARFVEPQSRRVVAPSVPLRAEPDPDQPYTSEALCGEPVHVFETTAEGWAWIQLERDGYVGWCPADGLAGLDPAPTHRVTAVKTFIYPIADLKSPPLSALSMGAEIALAGETATRGTRYQFLAGHRGAVIADHVARLDHHEADFVAVAERLVEVPYLWGGSTSLGLDCSGLIQLALYMAGVQAPRDTDMQEAGLGEDVALSNRLPPLTRGDLVFWNGHVGIMTDEETLLHANGYHMAVAKEPVERAIRRISATSFGPVTRVKRLP